MALDSMKEIFERSARENIPFWEIVLQYDMEERQVSRQASMAKMLSTWQAIQDAADSYTGTQRSVSGLVGGDGLKMRLYARRGESIGGEFMDEVIVQAISMAESNACMRRIVAAPTAGSCGVVPAVLLPLCEREHYTQHELLEALYVASGIGAVIAYRASISGAAGGCQAEIGSAAAMAAAASVELMGGAPAQCLDAASNALTNMMGLVCDPIAGLVEEPCQKRNAAGAAVALVILAAARPQFGSKLREEKAQGIEMMLTVDVSNSMLAEDFEPNRLERTKYAIGKLFEGLQQDRVGLVVFAGEPKVQLPITSDYRMARAFARRIDPSLVSVQGTAIGKALEQALLAFSGDTEQSHGRVIILITDGENHDDDAIAVAERAAQMGVKIFTIGIGTPEGAPIQIGGEFIKDEAGEMVVSKLNEEMLARIADITGGAYVRSSKQSIGLDEIVKAINEMEQTELSTVRFEEFNEQYQYLLIAALVLLLLEFVVLDRRNPLLAHLNIFREK